MPDKIEILRGLIDLGGTVLISGLVIYAGYRLLIRFGVPFIQSQQDMAKAMGTQAQTMSDMRDTVTLFVNRDNSEHREILLGLQVVGQELKTLVSEVERLKQWP